MGHKPAADEIEHLRLAGHRYLLRRFPIDLYEEIAGGREVVSEKIETEGLLRAVVGNFDRVTGIFIHGVGFLLKLRDSVAVSSGRGYEN